MIAIAVASVPRPVTRCGCPLCWCLQRVTRTVLFGSCPECGVWRKVRLDSLMGAHGSCRAIRYDEGQRMWIRPRPLHVKAICRPCRNEAHMGRTDDNRRLVTQIEALAGEIEAWGMGEHSEVERLPVLAAARLLDDRLHAAGLATASEHARASVGAGNRRLALLLDEDARRPLLGHGGLL